MSTVNTGNEIIVTLLRVRSDITNPSDPYYQEPLDADDIPTRISGNVQATEANSNSLPEYIAPYQNLGMCPLPTTSTTSSTTTTTTTLAPGPAQSFPITNNNTSSINIANFLLDGNVMGTHTMILAHGATGNQNVNYLGTTTSQVQLEIVMGTPVSATLTYTGGTVTGVITGTSGDYFVTFSNVNLTMTGTYNISVN